MRSVPLSEHRDVKAGSCHVGKVLFWDMGKVDAARAAGLPYLTATHDENNPRSGAVMARCGLTYRYTYRERWMPKDVDVSFRLWQIDLAPDVETYRAYWDEHPEHWVDVSGMPERAR